MTQTATLARFISKRRIATAFWATMFCLHAPALIGVLSAGDGSSSRLARCLILLPTQLFFLLKLLDVPWLRLPGGRRTLTAFCVIVLLLHARVMTNAALRLDDLTAIGQPVAALLAGGLGATLFTSAARASVVARDNTRRDRLRLSRAWRETRDRIAAALLPPRFELLAHRCAIDRAPPA
ncbi:MAG: hypothetical protein JXO22_15205 [Phycisphaerae bacterium]|nr:hypothetical protein [Phycisphaerae bacterium]